MRIHKHPVPGRMNKFVATEDEIYFVAAQDNDPAMIEILSEIFDLEDQEIYQKVDDDLRDGKIILGEYDPKGRRARVHLPVERNEYVARRIGEIFGNG